MFLSQESQFQAFSDLMPQTGHDLVAGPLRSLALGGISFWYTYQDIEFAILGVVFGTVGAWAIYFPGKLTGKLRVAHMSQHIQWKRFLACLGHWRAGARRAA